MKLSKAFIERIRQINPSYVHLELALEDEALRQMKPGQSLLVRSLEAEDAALDWDPYLREHWWPVGLTGKGTLIVERPNRETYQVGQQLSILGPVGKKYLFRPNLRNVLLIAYDTEPTPLTIMAPILLQNRVSTALILLGAARKYDTEHLPAEIEVIRGDDRFQWPDQVFTFGWADQIFVAVGTDDEMLRFKEVLDLIESRRSVDKSYVFGVFRPWLPCGTGACGACALTLKEGSQRKYVCQDGPAFDLTKVKL